MNYGEIMCLLLVVLVVMGDQGQVISKVQVFKCCEDGPSYASQLIFRCSLHHPVNGDVDQETTSHSLPSLQSPLVNCGRCFLLASEIVVKALDEKDNFLWYSMCTRYAPEAFPVDAVESVSKSSLYHFVHCSMMLRNVKIRSVDPLPFRPEARLFIPQLLVYCII